MHDGSISEANREKFRQLTAAFKAELHFYDIPAEHAELLARGREIFAAGLASQRFTSVNMYRLLLAQVLPDTVARVIYLDADTIVNLDIASLWREDLGRFPLGAVPELSVAKHFGQADKAHASSSFLYEKCGATQETVFNSGILLLDLTQLRSRNLFLEGLAFLAQYEDDFDSYDNDILIAFYGDNYQHLPWQYNIHTKWARAFDQSNNRTLPSGIYHYQGRDYGLDLSDCYHRLFLTNLQQTPWWQEDIISKSYQLTREITLTNVQNRLRQIQRIENSCRRKQRVFMGLAGDEARLRQDFKLRPEEHFITLSPGGQLPLPYDPRTHIYLIFWSNYGEVKALLEKAGLQEYEDFADGTRLMPEQSGDIFPTELTVLWQI